MSVQIVVTHTVSKNEIEAYKKPVPKVMGI